MLENRGMTSTISYKRSLSVLKYSPLLFLPDKNSHLRQAFHRNQKLTGGSRNKKKKKDKIISSSNEIID